MMYLDYAAATPMAEDALAVYCDTARRFPANADTAHALGRAAGARLRQAAETIGAAADAKADEIIFTSGATESNNLAILGAARQNRARGRHILTTGLEHPSVSGALAQLRQEDFTVETIPLGHDGQVDLARLRALLRPETVLVTVCAVDSETGVAQPVAAIHDCIRAAQPGCLLHTDAAQAAGKVPVSLHDAELITLAPYKCDGPAGVGVLLRQADVLLSPILYGGAGASPYRSGTPALPLIAAGAHALQTAFAHTAAWRAHTAALNARLRGGLARFERVRINSTAASVPQIFNFSVPGVRGERMQQALSARGVCVSSKSACCAPGTPSRPVLALTGDKKRALSTLRVSLSHRTSEADIDGFLAAFADVYRTLTETT